MCTSGKTDFVKWLQAGRYLYILMWVLCPMALQAQGIKVRKATAQNAYGGVAGSRSCRYFFVLQGKDLKQAEADSLWIGDHATDLKDKQSGIPQYGVNGSLPTLTLTATVHQPNANRVPIPPNDNSPKPPEAAPPEYKGVALFVYHLHGKRCTLTIPKITEWLPAVSYP
jgi:hypothetical protein